MVSRALLEEGGYNPGEQIRLILADALPLESYEKPTFTNVVDRALVADGRLAALIRESTIDYATRRLVTGAVYVAREGGWDPYDSAFLTALRRYLKERTGLDRQTRERVIPLLRESVRLNRTKLDRKKRQRFRSRERGRGQTKCYVCGREMDFADLDCERGASADHVWPRSLGGLNERANLVLACNRCNNAKDDALSGADFHYERFVRADEDLAFAELMVAWGVQGLSCAQCGRPPSQVGELFLVRDDEDDCWHIHNVTAYCDEHVPRR